MATVNKNIPEILFSEYYHVSDNFPSALEEVRSESVGHRNTKHANYIKVACDRYTLNTS